MPHLGAFFVKECQNIVNSNLNFPMCSGTKVATYEEHNGS